ncbi:MAG: flagellar motor switch protein FliN [Fimbriimonadaceae bacterium]|nr:flagellar motor switch protein FliN [Alphaproteobacteria bacterium]
MSLIDNIKIDLSVVLGQNSMPVHQLLRMGRGAVIELETHLNEEVEILANDVPVALGAVVIRGNKIAIEITKALSKLEIQTGVYN